jgi:hypothetical protein
MARPKSPSPRRGQLSLTAAEAAVGLLLLLSVTFTLALGVPDPATDRTQLDAYANDALTILATAEPRHQDPTRLSEVAASAAAFERERRALTRRIERILPPNVFYRIETPHGTAGYPLPDGVATGVASVPTRGGDVTLRVWYA